MELVRKNIKSLEEYKTVEIPFKIKLDANEGKNIIFEDLLKEGIKFDENFQINFYPDNNAGLLKEKLSKIYNLSDSNFIVGNGSSEMLELIIRTFVETGEKVISFVPTFSMYSIYSQIYSVEFVGVNCNADFSLDIDTLIDKASELKPKLIFLCNPNNPTGAIIAKEDLVMLVESTDAIVAIDEAYIEYAEGSMADEILKYKNLIVIRTLSKAFGLAALRLGYMIADETIINYINKVRPPYNLNAISQQLGCMALDKIEKVNMYVEDVKLQREYIYKEMLQLQISAYESHANFVFFKTDIPDLTQKLADKGILIRAFSKELKGFYRVSIGYEDENIAFINALKEIIANENC